MVAAVPCYAASYFARGFLAGHRRFGLYGLLLATLFLVFQAPDVSLSMLVVGSVAYPLVVLTAIARVRRDRGGKGE